VLVANHDIARQPVTEQSESFRNWPKIY